MVTEKKPKIIAIDDENDFIETLVEYFEPRGYDIEAASRAAQGIEMIKVKDPDVVILDLKMPGVSGEEVLALLKAKESKAKVIFVSAFDDAGKTKARMQNAGAYAYLDKPLNSLKELEEIVNRAYGESAK